LLNLIDSFCIVFTNVRITENNMQIKLLTISNIIRKFVFLSRVETRLIILDYVA